MTDKQLQELTKRAYHVPELSDDARRTIRRNVRLSLPSQRTRWRFAVVAGVAAGVASLGAPIARANYITYSLAAGLRDVRPFTVTITVVAKNVPAGAHYRQAPMVVSVANDICTMTDSDTTYLYSNSKVYQYRPEDGRSIVRKGNSSFLNYVTTPDRVADQIGKIQVGKQVQFAGKVLVKGRELDEWVVDSPTYGHVTLDIDPVTGSPLRMLLNMNANQGGLIFDYDRDSVKAKQIVESRLAAIRAVPVLDVEKRRWPLSQWISSTPMHVFGLPRDNFTLYRVDTNARGDVLVLYTCDGKHKEEGNMGNWLKLKDSTGTPWLSGVVDLSFSKLDLKGQYPKAQVFFHPSRPTQATQVNLSLTMQQGEFVDDRPGRSIVRYDLGNFTPRPAEIGQPDWLYYSFGMQDSSWLALSATVLRFRNALLVKNYAFAQQIGQQLESNFPDMAAGVFFEKAQLSLGLYHAFKATGDAAKAREYLAKATQQGQGFEDYGFKKDLNSSRKAEGL